MSDLAEAGGGPITRTISGEQVTFAELFFTEKRELIRKYRDSERQKLEDDMAASGLSDEQKYSERRAFSSEIVGDAAWAAFFMSDEGKYAILEASLKKANANIAVLNKIDLDSDAIMALCAAITHTKLRSKDEKGQAQNPQTPAPTKGYGQE